MQSISRPQQHSCAPDPTRETQVSPGIPRPSGPTALALELHARTAHHTLFIAHRVARPFSDHLGATALYRQSLVGEYELSPRIVSVSFTRWNGYLRFDIAAYSYDHVSNYCAPPDGEHTRPDSSGCDITHASPSPVITPFVTRACVSGCKFA